MSSRLRVQSFIENDLGCKDLAKWASYNQQVKNYVLTAARTEALEPLLKADVADTLFKAILSLFEALQSLAQGRHSWAVIKLYYSTFYLLRASLGAKSIAFVKNNGIFTLKLVAGEVPKKRDGGKRNGETIRGDHKTVIATYIDVFDQTDFFLTNKVGGEKIVYEWLMGKREEVNYRNATFLEPEQAYFDKATFNSGAFQHLIDLYFSNQIYCFLEEHCCLALPLQLGKRTIEEVMEFREAPSFTQTQTELLISILQAAHLEQNKNLLGLIYG